MFTLKVSLVALALSSVGFAVPASGAQHSTSSEAKSGSAAAKSSNAPSHLPTDATAAKSTNPTASAVVSHKAGDHGDGFYTGTQHDNGTTTFQYHGKGKPVAPSPASAPALGRRLNPDEQVICSPGGNVPVSDLDAARSALSAQMGEGLFIGNHQRAFVSRTCDCTLFAARCSFASIVGLWASYSICVLLCLGRVQADWGPAQ
jgi:hypothetical protein